LLRPRTQPPRATPLWYLCGSIPLCADRGWNTEWNGIKRQQQDDRVGYFGVINLLGPRTPTQRPFDKFWNDQFTYVQLRYELLNGATGAPIALGRTYMTFYDFDAGMSQVAGAEPAIEMMQMGPQATALELPAITEIRQYARWSDVPELDAGARAIVNTMPDAGSWGMIVNHGTVYGVGDDNPLDPYQLTALQAGRSIMVMFEHINTFQVRYT